MVDHPRLPERERHGTKNSPADAPALDPGRMSSHDILQAWQDGVIGYWDAPPRIIKADLLREPLEALLRRREIRREAAKASLPRFCANPPHRASRHVSRRDSHRETQRYDRILTRKSSVDDFSAAAAVPRRPDRAGIRRITSLTRATDAGQARSRISSAHATGLHMTIMPQKVRTQLGSGMYITIIHIGIRNAKDRRSRRTAGWSAWAV